ncbi:MAG: DUF1566 domain-containing protein [Sphingobacteriaceae bacterium]
MKIMKKLMYLFLILELGHVLSCKKDSTVLRKVGEKYEGGVIAYLLKSGDTGYDPKVQHGIIAAIEDQSKSIQWSNSNVNTGAGGWDIGKGKTNTETIVQKQGVGNYAAKLCADLSLNGYTDWYLPSRYELEQIGINKTLIGGFDPNYYWCSSETNQTDVLCYDFGPANGTFNVSKADFYRVRAIRYF